MSQKRVLIIGSGGREHAIAWKLSLERGVGEIFVAPGNGGAQEIATNVPIPVSDFTKLAAFAVKKKIDLTIVGPDDPLAMGIVNLFRSKGLRIFGPTEVAAQMESSKSFAKRIMRYGKVPTGSFREYNRYKAAVTYLNQKKPPYVIKADGLALGKGVAICQTLIEGKDFLQKCMRDDVFGKAGRKVLIEEYLTGQEISIHALTDGNAVKLFPPAQDHKRQLAGDLGPNTGGMGVVSPLPWVSKQLLSTIESSIVETTIDTLEERGITYSGCLYPGLMVSEGKPNVLEFNARFGDPETQAYMRLLKSDLFPLLDACSSGSESPHVDSTFLNLDMLFNPGYVACVVMAAKGYPGPIEKGKPIYGIKEAESIPGVTVFQAGTVRDGLLLKTNGGRVLAVTAVGSSLGLAISLAYKGVSCINFDGMQFRQDIGKRALEFAGF